ncbi:MAG: T9SS type A sorting domain-containing protein [Bacteroidetes bacterium]|nr:T9SS type A sorting domain-containing protein [Bacteroidota bacterium]
MALSTDMAGNLYVGDTYNSRIREISFCSVRHITSSPKDVEIAEMASAYFSMNDNAGFAKYQWQENDGTGFKDINYGGIYSGVNSKILSISIAFSTMNNYLYRCVRMQDGCADTTSVAKLIIDPLGVDKISDNNITVFPNPANNKLLITAPFAIRTVELINVVGNRVLSNTFNDRQTAINMEGLPTGNYFVRINKQYVQKIIKE